MIDEADLASLRLTACRTMMPCDDADVLVERWCPCPQYCVVPCDDACVLVLSIAIASPLNERKIVVACVDELSTDLYTFTTLDLKKVQMIADNVVETLFRRF